MQHQDPRVDRSRGAVYQAEDSVARIMRSQRRAVRVGRTVVTLPAEVRFGSLEAVQRFADQVVEHPASTSRHPGRGPVTVEVRRGFRAATYQDGRIRIPAADPRGRWAMTRSVVLHECAHHLAASPGHGRAFRDALAHLYELHLGEGAALLLRHLLAPLDDLPEPVAADGAVRRVAALLAKAESTTSQEESEAYLAKAALVAQRHSIDLAVAAWSAGSDAGAPTHRMLSIGAPRAPLNTHLVSLLLAVARAWDVPVDIGHGSTYVLLYGMPGDLDQVESMYVTASTLMAARAQEHVRGDSWRGTSYVPASGQPPRPVTATVARNAFCLGFVHRLGERLAATAGTARAQAEPAVSGAGGRAGSVALALRARDLAVTDYYRRTSRARGRWRSTSSGAGSAAGSRRAGARAAEEYGRPGLPSGARAVGGPPGW